MEKMFFLLGINYVSNFLGKKTDINWKFGIDIYILLYI